MTGLTESLHDGVLTLTLDRAEKRNALNTAILDGLAAGMARAELEQEVRVVVLRGAGKDFCAGADLAELLASVDNTLEENERAALGLGEIFLALRRLPKPTVAVVQGRALAGGAGLALACDVVLAAESAQFGFPEVERGFVPAMVMTMLRRAVGEKRAFDLVGTGRTVGAPEAVAMGLVSRAVADDRVEDAVREVVGSLRAASATAFALTKQLFTELDGMSFTDGILLGARVNALSRATPEFRTRIAEFLK